MKKNYLFTLFCAFVFIESAFSQIITYTAAVPDITLQCSGGTSNRTGVAYNPCFNLYYSVNAGSGSYPIETFSVGGGNSLNSTTQGSDYRGLWWNNVNNRLEGNTYNSGGVYSNTLNAAGWAQTTTSFISSATMPNAQSAGHANIAGNIIYYYSAGTLYLYSKSSNTLISSATISGLPSSNLNTYGIVYVGFPGGKDVAVYDYVVKAVYYINATTAAYSGSCALPTSAPAAQSFMMGYANNRFFLYNSSASQWIGYPLSNTPPPTAFTATLAASNTLVCQGNPVNLTASGASSYTWSFGGNNATAVVTPTSNSVYSVTATSSLGCIGQSTVAVNIIPGAVVSVSASPSAICSGASATLTGGGGVNSYTWNTNSNANSIIVSPTSNTTYTVQGTNTQNCTTTATVLINVSGNLPVLSVTSSTNQTCLGKTATVSATGALTYTWSNGLQNGVSFTPSVTTTYTVNGQNGCGTTTSFITISVTPLPVSVLSTPTTICAGDPATLSAVSAATGYTWQPFSLTGASVVVSPTATTVYTVAVTDGTCAGLATLTLNALQIPTLSSAASSTNVCAGYPVTLTATGGLNYTWTPGNITGASIVVTPTTPIQYSVVANNSLGCFGGSSQIIITNPSPTLVTSSTSNLMCAGDAATLTVVGANTYTWDNGSNTTSIVVTPSSSTQYTVSGTTNSCTSTQVIPLNVFAPLISVSGPSTVCNGGTVNIVASGANIYSWSNGSQSATLTVAPNISSTFTLTTISTSANINCNSTKTVQLNVLSLPSISVTANRTVMCKNESNVLTASGASSYTWNTSSNNTSISITPSLVTTLIYTVNGTGANGCQNTSTLQLKVNACTGLTENKNSINALNIYPNPSAGNVKIEFTSAIELSLINQLGQVIENIQLNENNHYTYQLDNLATGVYFVVGKNSNASITEKIIVQR